MAFCATSWARAEKSALFPANRCRVSSCLEIVKLEASREAARSVGCTALLETSLSRYVERDGGPYGVQQPAAVTVDYRLYDVNSGAVLCHGRFDEQQESLMENLFAIGKAGKRGITWRTAEELTREGLQSILTECRYLGK